MRAFGQRRRRFTRPVLAQAGHDVVIFDENHRPPLLVGESTVPGIVTVLRQLGLEQRVEEISVRKPGVTFYPNEKTRVAFSFESLPARYPRYAYNVPRPAFDGLLRQRALECGASCEPIRAELKAFGNELLLTGETLAGVRRWEGRQPYLIVDASGRRRLSARLVGGGATVGPRKDVSYFAHFEGMQPEAPVVQVAIHYLESGWAWRIPLKM
jgi:2-polyprenyl-6-methoxyphenol hydroxylase-like FAD-dependent oxidoreductase